MKRVAQSLIVIGFVALPLNASSAAAPAADRNLYLEQVDGARALAQVKAWNAATRAELEKQPGYADYRAKALALLSTNQKIAEPDQILGQKVLNFWQDEQHPRGMWRVSPLAAYAAGHPQWRNAPRHRRDEQDGQQEMGVQGRDLPFARLRRLHGQPVERRRRRRRDPRVRPRQGGIRRWRLYAFRMPRPMLPGRGRMPCSWAPTSDRAR